MNQVARAVYQGFGLVEAKIESCKPLQPANTALGSLKPTRIRSIDPYDRRHAEVDGVRKWTGPRPASVAALGRPRATRKGVRRTHPGCA
jgi:hypothetical protein